MMSILTDRNNGIVKWEYNGKDIIIQNSNMMCAFEYGNEMVMLKVKNQDGEIGFVLYDINGGFILSYVAKTGEISIGSNHFIRMDNLITVEYSRKDKKVVALIGMKERERKLVIIDYNGCELASIPNPVGYTFYYTKNLGDSIMAVCQGNSEITKDKYGRNDWNFRIDLNNYYVEKVSITQ